MSNAYCNVPREAKVIARLELANVAGGNVNTARTFCPRKSATVTVWLMVLVLTSVLVLFFLYLGHIALVRAFDDPVRGARAGSILALVGVINLPIIKFSVNWWNTLHQPASIGLTGAPTIAASMLWPLLFSAIGFSLLFAAITIVRSKRRNKHDQAICLH